MAALAGTGFDGTGIRSLTQAVRRDGWMGGKGQRGTVKYRIEVDVFAEMVDCA
jgi:hypothetical protein